MKKYFIIGILALIWVGILLFIFLGKDKKTWEGNVLIITLDTTRADTIGCYGESEVKTPNIDRLAKNGIRFENCYSPVPLTLPSHCTIFTGRYPIGHGVRNNGTYYLSKQEITLGELFKAKGYHTYAVISAFVLLAKFGLKQGFDRYDDSLDSYKMLNTYKSEIKADYVYEKFKSWFDKNQRKKFLAWVHFYDPHTPYHPPKGFFKEENKNDKYALYKGEISFMDVYVGRIIDDLDSAGILDNTLVVVVGDHGEAFGEHEEFAGHSIFCYEENLKVPFIIYNRRFFKKPAVIEDRVNTADIMPTLLELAGIELSKNIQGKTLVPFLNRNRKSGKPIIYFESMFGKEEMGWAPLTGIIDGDYKFISLPEPELYNLEEDAEEKNNLFRIKTNVSKKLDKRLGSLVLKYSIASGETKRELSNQDIQQLRSLGYISAFSSKSKRAIDPKRGIIFNLKLKDLSAKIRKGILDEPERELKRIITRTPEMVNYLVYILLYQISLRRDNINDALNSLKAGIKKFPDCIAFRPHMARIFFDSKKYDRAIFHCKQMLGMDRNYTRAYILLGDIYDKLGKSEESLNNYKKAIRLEPENISLKVKYAELLMKNKKFKDALEIYNGILPNRDVWNTPKILYKIALFNSKYGAMEKAEELLNRIIRFKPEGKYYYVYALILSKNGKIFEAFESMNIAIDKYSHQLTDDQKKKALNAIQVWKNSM